MVPRLGSWSTNCPSHPVHSSPPRARSLRPKALPTPASPGITAIHSANNARRTFRGGGRPLPPVRHRHHGAERLTWLHTITSQHVAALPDGGVAENLGLDVNGRVLHHFVQTDLDGVT